MNERDLRMELAIRAERAFVEYEENPNGETAANLLLAMWQTPYWYWHGNDEEYAKLVKMAVIGLVGERNQLRAALAAVTTEWDTALAACRAALAFMDLRPVELALTANGVEPYDVINLLAQLRSVTSGQPGEKPSALDRLKSERGYLEPGRKQMTEETAQKIMDAIDAAKASGQPGVDWRGKYEAAVEAMEAALTLLSQAALSDLDLACHDILKAALLEGK